MLFGNDSKDTCCAHQTLLSSITLCVDSGSLSVPLIAVYKDLLQHFQTNLSLVVERLNYRGMYYNVLFS